MPFNKDKDFSYKVDPDFDYTVDEKGNSYIALRKIEWNGRGEYKLDLRKYISTEKGEQMGKGVSFLTDEGPHELVRVLMENGYGKSDEIAEVLVYERLDILKQAIKKMDKSLDIPDTDDDTEEKLYDTRRLFEDE